MHTTHLFCCVESCKCPMGSCEGPQEAINKSDLQSVEKMESLTSFDDVSSYKIGDIFLACGTYHVTTS